MLSMQIKGQEIFIIYREDGSMFGKKCLWTVFDSVSAARKYCQAKNEFYKGTEFLFYFEREYMYNDEYVNWYADVR